MTPVPQKAILMQPEANVQKQVQEQSARPAKPAVRLPDYAAELAEASQPAKQNAAAAAVGTAQASARRAGAPAGTQDVEVRPAVSEQNTVRLEDTGAQSGRVSPFAQDNRSVPAPVLPELRESLMRDMKALFVRPDAPEFDGESLQRQIESLNRSLAELGAQAASAGAEGKALAAQLETYAAQLRQQEQIQQFTYLQIPVMLREKESTAELYVFHRDKHGKPASPGATVVMLVLDTQSMGRVESVVRAEDRKVHIRMRVENERVAQLFEGKTALLDKALEEEGYTLTRMACSVAGTPVSPQNAQETAFNLLKDGTRRLDVVI